MIIFWLICTTLAFLVIFRYLQARDPVYRNLWFWTDVWNALKLSVLGPIALIGFLAYFIFKEYHK